MEQDTQNDNPLDMTTRAKDSPWYAHDVAAVLQPQTRSMLQTHANILPDDIIAHIEVTRSKAWALAPYPSVGALTWLNPYLTLHLSHDLVLEKVKSGATILDCACMIAPDLRYLASRGAPAERMYGFDIEAGFFDIGFDFYRDRERWHGSFFEADGTKPLSETKLAVLKGKMDILWCPKFLHLFDRAQQIAVSCNLVGLLRSVTGSLFIGSQNGRPVPEEMPVKEGSLGHGQNSIFGANAEEMQRMWAEVGERTGTKWEVEARLLDLRTVGLHVEDGSWYKRVTGYNLQWTARLVEA
ncbi:uncharacterized protein LTR77_005365 [Saxophila tyrrhenica]|uniref:Methyltransferase domain-containing protein n=1 Tax=Saxophila tyrrhenica TaxID=1690608 RepID=A0AAV9PCI7_9PEZI|nr:hypothetical protein LTR77_005365 [Saxophila tyrrhenica]